MTRLSTFLLINHKSALTLLLTLFVIALVPTKSVQATSSSTSIIGGEEVEEGAYPWMVGIIENGQDDIFWAQYCGGTLIHPQWVLTAAHCTYSFGNEVKASEIDVLTGQNKLRGTTGERIPVEQIIRHPAYKSTIGDADLALIKLAHPSAQPIVTMADSTMINVDESGAMGTVLGWGRTNTNIRVNHLQQVRVPLVTTETCTSAYQILGYVMTSNMLCAGYQEGGKDACSGDSGGPLVIRGAESDDASQWVQVGVVSWGKGCAQANAYGVYTHIAHFKGWIDVQIALNTIVSDTNVISDSGSTTLPAQGQTISLTQVYMPIVNK